MALRFWLAGLALVFETLLQPQPGTLRIRITIAEANQQTRPVPRHALLISDNPTTAAPQRAITNADGTVEVRLRPGNYTIESDEPLIFQGKAYEWRQTLDVPAGQTTTIDFNTANAEIQAADLRPAAGGTSASGLLLDWQNSVVTIWSPVQRGAGFLIDGRGLIATNQWLAGAEKTVEVQLSSAVKVAGRVLVSDAHSLVAIVWIDPKAVASVRAMRLADGTQPPPPPDTKVFTIEAPMEEEKNLTVGKVIRSHSGGLLADIDIDEEGMGAPLFTASGDVLGIITPKDETANIAKNATLVIGAPHVRSALAAAEKKLAVETPPSAAPLPVEGEALFPDDPLRDALAKRKGPLRPYRLSTGDFDVHLITPILTFAARRNVSERAAEPRGPLDARTVAERAAARRALQDFGNWWDYVRRDPPAIMIRATPKLTEPFWKSVLRGAVQTQGVSLPPIKRIKAGFARMQLFCGDAEVTPIHPFKIEHRTGANEAVYEGFYVYDPAGVGPHCGTVKLTLFSDKAPDKGDTRLIDAKVLQQIADDFAPYRAARAR